MNSHENFESVTNHISNAAGATSMSMGRRVNMQQNKNANVTVSLGNAEQTGSSL